MRIGELAKFTGVPVKTLRYWEEAGVLEAPPRDDSGYRQYPTSTSDQVHFILSAQAVGLSLSVISGIIRLRTEGVTPCEQVEGLLRERLGELDRRIRSLKDARREVAKLLDRAARMDPQECDERSVCHLIADVSAHP